MMNSWSALFKGDRVLWILIGLLMVSSLPLIYSSIGQLALRNNDGNIERFLLAHGFKLMLGGIIMLFVHRIPYLWLGRISAWGVYIELLDSLSISNSDQSPSPVMSRLTLRTTPMAKALMRMELPPCDINGRVCPVTGMALTETSIFTTAWAIKAMPIPDAM